MMPFFTFNSSDMAELGRADTLEDSVSPLEQFLGHRLDVPNLRRRLHGALVLLAFCVVGTILGLVTIGS